MRPGTAHSGGRRSPQASAGARNNTQEPARSGKKKTVGVSQLSALRRRRAAYHGCNEFRSAPFGDDSTLITNPLALPCRVRPSFADAGSIPQHGIELDSQSAATSAAARLRRAMSSVRSVGEVRAGERRPRWRHCDLRAGADCATRRPAKMSLAARL